MAAEGEAGQRITFNVTPKARRALEALVNEGFAANQTDAINRAVALAQWLHHEVEHGAEVEVRHRNQVPVKVVFL